MECFKLMKYKNTLLCFMLMSTIVSHSVRAAEEQLECRFRFKQFRIFKDYEERSQKDLNLVNIEKAFVREELGLDAFLNDHRFQRKTYSGIIPSERSYRLPVPYKSTPIVVRYDKINRRLLIHADGLTSSITTSANDAWFYRDSSWEVNTYSASTTLWLNQYSIDCN